MGNARGCPVPARLPIAALHLAITAVSPAMDSDSSLDSELVRASKKGGKKRKAVSDSEYEESDESVSLDEESEWEEEARRRVRSGKRRGRPSGLQGAAGSTINTVDCDSAAPGRLQGRHCLPPPLRRHRCRCRHCCPANPLPSCPCLQQEEGQRAEAGTQEACTARRSARFPI